MRRAVSYYTSKTAELVYKALLLHLFI